MPQLWRMYQDLIRQFFSPPHIVVNSFYFSYGVRRAEECIVIFILILALVEPDSG